jgi:hypothetical protein
VAGDALLSELLEVEVLGHRSPEPRRLPIYVKPLPGEALGSWWHRLGRRFELSAQGLSSAVMGSDLVLTRDWSSRPPLELLVLTHDRTGIPMDTLRSMTLHDWAEVSYGDEAAGRFNARRYLDGAPKTMPRGLVVCGECLRSDAHPYLRLIWLIGWVAICPVHDTVMVSRCPDCRAPLRLPLPGSLRPFAADRCTTCFADIRTMEMTRALPAAADLQGRLLAGKQTGTVELAGIGLMDWRALVMLSDVLVGMFWHGTTDVQKYWFGQSLAEEIGAGEGLQLGSSREGSLELLAWLLGAWAGNSATAIVAELGKRWRVGEWRQASLNIGPTIEDVRDSRILELLSALEQ